MSATRSFLGEGRWHFQHGPIDLILHASGQASIVAAAHEKAWVRFQTILKELVGELSLLKCPIDPIHPIGRIESIDHLVASNPCQGVVAQNMWQCAAVLAHSGPNGFITPMVCVAGAVAQEMLKNYEHESISTAWVNNGGDIALLLQPQSVVNIGLVANPDRFLAKAHALVPNDLSNQSAKDINLASGLGLDGQFQIHGGLTIRGVATSGWRGRSFSMGIADSVTVLARTATQADAAASIIGNAVNLDHPGILRKRACDVKDDSDLGERMVTVSVPELCDEEVAQALQLGVEEAMNLPEQSGVEYAVLCLGSQIRTISHNEGPSTQFSTQPTLQGPTAEFKTQIHSREEGQMRDMNTLREMVT
jgi:hypothetical protein